MAKLTIEVEVNGGFCTRVMIDGQQVGALQSLEFHADKDHVIPTVKAVLLDGPISAKSRELLKSLPWVGVRFVEV